MYVRFIVINLRIDTNFFYGRGGWYKGIITGEMVVKVIKRSLLQTIALFCILDLVGILSTHESSLGIE